MAGELRLRVAKHGATQEDRARLRITFAAADEADEKRSGVLWRLPVSAAARSGRCSGCRGSLRSPTRSRLSGYEVLDWITEMLAAPDHAEYVPFVPYREQEDFILAWYQLDPETGRRKFNRGVLGRPRGWGKRPLLAALACAEALGPVVFDGWDADGQPVGKPWALVRTPVVQLAAVSEEQVRNTWAPVLEMLKPEAPIHDAVAGLEVMDTFIKLPNRGRMSAITSSARTVKGARAVFAVLDQSEEWVPSNGGVRLANTMRANAAKVGGTTLESPNAFIPGENSVAEESAAYWAAIREGRAKDDGLLYDHREAPADTDMSDRQSLIDGSAGGVRRFLGHPGGCVLHSPVCAPGHVDLDRFVATIWDPAQDVQQSRSRLPQPDHPRLGFVGVAAAVGRLYGPGEDRGREGRHRVGVRRLAGPQPGQGRRHRAGRLPGVRWASVRDTGVGTARRPRWVRTGRPTRWRWTRWCRNCFRTVAGRSASTLTRRGWTEHVAKWEAQFSRRLKVKATQNAPIAVWPRGKTASVTTVVEQLRAAIANGECSHDGSSALTRHVLNARRRA